MLSVKQTLAYIARTLGLDYEFDRWTGELSYPYWVGEYYGDSVTDEAGQMSHSPIICGFCRGDASKLYDQVEAVRKYLKDGLYYQADGVYTYTSVVAVQQVPTQEETLFKYEIRLNIKTWEV